MADWTDQEKKVARRSTREGVSYCLSPLVKICSRESEREILLSTRDWCSKAFYPSVMTRWSLQECSTARKSTSAVFCYAGTSCAPTRGMANATKKILLVD